MSLLTGSLLFSALFCVVLCDDKDVKVVENVIAYTNKFFTDNNVTELELGDFFFPPVHIRDGRMSQVNTLELQEGSVITKKTDKDGITYDFNLNIGMKKVMIKYKFNIMLPLTTPKGMFSIDVGKNSFFVEGKVFVGNNGSCSAILHDADVLRLEDHPVKIDPKDVRIPFVRKFYEKIINEAVLGHIGTVVSLSILGAKFPQSFDEMFNDIVCSGIKEYA